MVRQIRLHRTDDRNIIDALADLGKNFTDFDATLTTPVELEGRCEGRAGLTFGPEIRDGQWLPVVLCQNRLRIERVHVGWTAIEEKMNDPFGLPREMRSPRRQWNQGFRGMRRRNKANLGKQICHSQTAQSHPAAVQEFTAGQKGVFQFERVMGHILKPIQSLSGSAGIFQHCPSTTAPAL